MGHGINCHCAHCTKIRKRLNQGIVKGLKNRTIFIRPNACDDDLRTILMEGIL